MYSIQLKAPLGNIYTAVLLYIRSSDVLNTYLKHISPFIKIAIEAATSNMAAFFYFQR